MKLTNRIEQRRLPSREVLGLEPIEALPFDPERDITAEDRSRMKQYIETQDLNGPDMIWAFCVLFPDQVGSFAVEGPFDTNNPSEAENVAEDLIIQKLLHPNKFKQVDYKKTMLHEDLRQELDTKRQKYPVDQWANWSSAAIRFKTLFPEDSTALLSADQLAEFRQELAWDDHSRRKDNLWVLANFKLLFPGEFADLQLEDNDWRELRTKVEKIRKNLDTDRAAPYNLTFALFSAKVLAAEHAEINSQGNVVITPRSRRLSSPKPLPARDLSA